MKITVNGKDIEFGGGAVSELLAGYSIDPASVVVEKNGEIVHREKYESDPVSGGDIIEIVRFVGGG